MTTNEEEQEVEYTWLCEIGSVFDTDFDMVIGEGDCWFDPDASARELIDTLEQKDRDTLLRKSGCLVLESFDDECDEMEYHRFIEIKAPDELVDRLLHCKKTSLDKSAFERVLRRQHLGDLAEICDAILYLEDSETPSVP